MSPIVNIGIKAARQAGNLIIRYLDRLHRLSVDTKGKNDFVSEVDKMAEDAIIETILKLYPGHHILAEESGVTAPQTVNETDTDVYEWIIDPLDGTTNFLHGNPHFSVSIGVRRNGRMEHAIIFDPLRNEMFSASQGQGAQLNDRRIRANKNKLLANSMVATGLPPSGLVHYENWMSSYRSLLTRVGGMRQSGSAALDLAYVACGRIDAYWEPGLQIWDVAAGSLLVREAGGLVADFNGQQEYLESGNIVAAGQGVFTELVATLKPRQFDSR